MSEQLLSIRGLRTYFDTARGSIAAVDGIDMDIYKGEIVGIVGESGCGKSLTSLSIMGLNPGRIGEGTICFKGRNLLQLSDKQMQAIRGNEISMIFQEPMTSLNPVYTIGQQLIEAIRLHRRVGRKQARLDAVDMLRQVGIARPEQLVDEYPHRLSGGMRQRVMIAMAMICEPELLLADEPTTALDVTIQAQILEMMRQLGQRHQTAILLVTHDLGVVAEMCSRVIVMYAGRIVEQGNVRELFRSPVHPYTQGLLKSIPTLSAASKRLYSISGQVPPAGEHGPGCAFAPRCAHAMERCHQAAPQLAWLSASHASSCWLQPNKEGGAVHASATN
ncbi:ABC transporter ATP-binding protein [Paenibacillaceae bacterium]|nr:ABC transporter ATP-binding protein [Paenibacillaceae bacterium]